MEGVSTLGTVDELMFFFTVTIGALTNEQPEDMVANLNYDRYIMTEPDGYLEQKASNLMAAIQVYERGVCTNPRVYQLERESKRLQWLIDSILKAQNDCTV
jgi:hypothetical protein